MTQILAYENMSKEALIEHHKLTLQQHADDMDMLSKELAERSHAKIDRPMAIGCVRFGVGIKASTVLDAAARHYDFVTNEKREQDRIELGKLKTDNFLQYGAPTDLEAYTAWLEKVSSPTPATPIELGVVADILAEGNGCWVTCSGCHESYDGAPTGPYSQVMKCTLGVGCRECGGIGAIWDTTNYAEMGDAMAAAMQGENSPIAPATHQASTDPTAVQATGTPHDSKTLADWLAEAPSSWDEEYRSSK